MCSKLSATLPEPCSWHSSQRPQGVRGHGRHRDLHSFPTCLLSIYYTTQGCGWEGRQVQRWPSTTRLEHGHVSTGHCGMLAYPVSIGRREKVEEETQLPSLLKSAFYGHSLSGKLIRTDRPWERHTASVRPSESAPRLETNSSLGRQPAVRH